MDDIHKDLEAIYCPPLDPALLPAILSDYDLRDESAVAEARTTLDSLKLSALEQESNDFDPSGTSAPGDAGSTARPESCPEAWGLLSEDTDLTSVSSGLQSVELSGGSSNEIGVASEGSGEYLGKLEEADDETKVRALQDMFPAAKQYSIAHTLKKCHGSVDRAMDELLNHAFFDTADPEYGEQRVSAKGIDAFYVDDAGQKRQGKAGKRKGRYGSLDESGRRSSSLPSSPAVTESPWKTGSKDIDFISSRTKISSGTIASLFYQNGASVPATIKALISCSSAKHHNSNVLSDDPSVQAHAYELGQDFPTLPPQHLTELIRLTHPSTAAAHELARAMTAQPVKQGKLEIIPVYAPINTNDDDSGAPWTSVSARTPRSSAIRHNNNSDPSDLASTYASAGHRAFAQASAAYRRGRSDHLMGAAAGYYSQVGRDYATRSKEVTAEAADALVASQSSSGHVDLHGVSVKDAVRIARARTEQWWRASGRRALGFDGRVRREEVTGGASSGLVIVTGMGRHSKGGRGLLGPAVGKMLAQEGWHARCDEGVWVVTGKRG